MGEAVPINRDPYYSAQLITAMWDKGLGIVQIGFSERSWI